MSKIIEKIVLKIYKDCKSSSSDSGQHLLTLFSLALASKGKNFLELGCREGDTALPILLGAYLNKGKLFSVDIKKTTFIPPKELKKNFKFIKQDAIKFLKKNITKKFDFVYVDDWHSYSHVKNELELLDQMVSPSGIIVLHDLMYGGTAPFYHSDLILKTGQWAEGGPYRAVAELDPNFWELVTIPWNNGLTILRKKYSSKYHIR